jgi:hypothetical protein
MILQDIADNLARCCGLDEVGIAMPFTASRARWAM